MEVTSPAITGFESLVDAILDPMSHRDSASADQAPVETKRQQWANDSDARLASRLKQLLDTAGISDKDRKLLRGNLQRLLGAQQSRGAS